MVEQGHLSAGPTETVLRDHLANYFRTSFALAVKVVCINLPHAAMISDKQKFGYSGKFLFSPSKMSPSTFLNMIYSLLSKLMQFYSASVGTHFNFILFVHFK
jgi:hypothetical protein